MSRRNRLSNILRAVNHYLGFFLMVAFVISCCMMLFLSVMSSNLNIKLTEENIQTAAKLTFGNVVLLSFLFTIIDTARRRLSVDRPAKKITDAAYKIMQGDFSVRISTEQKFGMDDKWLEVIECFNKMAEELGSVETLRTDFIANVSHEIKTPLAIMQNYGTLLQAEELSDEKRTEYAKGIKESSRRMADMITNILKLNRLENQQIYPHITEFDLGEQLCEILLQYENVWENKNIQIETDIAENVRVKADAELFSLVWNNLLSNAFKFTESGGTVSVVLETVGDNVGVKIKDTGCGMTAEEGAHIFEKFYQGDSSRSVEGNGLGLALVKRVVDITNGEIAVESATGKGTTVSVKLKMDGRDN